MPGTAALLTDRYELTMLDASLRDGTADRECVFQVFARALPAGRRYGVLAGTGRLLDLLAGLRFAEDELDWLRAQGVLSARGARRLAAWSPASLDVEGYAEGEAWFPHSPVLSVRGRFADAVLLETVVLSVLNHDSAVASAASRMTAAAQGRPCVEMGSRRTHEEAAVAAARAAYVAGFASTSNLQAGRRFGVPTSGTAAHAFTLVHDDEAAAFAAQVGCSGADTTLLVDTYDVLEGVRTAVRVAGPSLGAVRIDSGDLAVLAQDVRAELDRLGATSTRVVVTGDLDEHAIASLGSAPVDGYGVGTSVALGSGAPTCGFVYKLVEVQGRPVAKRSTGKAGHGGARVGWRRLTDGVAVAEVVARAGARGAGRPLTVPLWRDGGRCPAAPPGRAGLDAARGRHAAALEELPRAARSLTRGEPVLPTETVGAV